MEVSGAEVTPEEVVLELEELEELRARVRPVVARLRVCVSVVDGDGDPPRSDVKLLLDNVEQWLLTCEKVRDGLETLEHFVVRLAGARHAECCRSDLAVKMLLEDVAASVRAECHLQPLLASLLPTYLVVVERKLDAGSSISSGAVHDAVRECERYLSGELWSPLHRMSRQLRSALAVLPLLEATHG
jgi:hypothetical protein